jgi:branched-chain amino acid aminotransferase
MTETMEIAIKRVAQSRIREIDFNNIPFGKVYSDHMFVADYKGKEWKNFQIVPYEYMTISPASPAIHYGQSIFEGMKAYKNQQGEALTFRPLDNYKRLNLSGHRLCMPHLPEEVFMEGLSTLLNLDKEWIPSAPGTSLYVRPFIFAADEYIGIRPSDDFKFMIITCPVGAYYSAPVKVKIETHYSRAMEGGTGGVKAAGNYAGALYPAKLAQDKGYHQLIWTDAKTHTYIEESGTMNVMFIIDDTLITAPVGDTILPGITRDSVLTLAREWGLQVEERKLAVTELIDAITTGRLKEAFGTGTAATIAHIELIGYEGVDYTLPEVSGREFSNKVLTTLDDIRLGKVADTYNWVYKI